ncbi:MAG: hypothetical protein HY000_21845 [Planctomycetes bacterium]|nr:hypothetical protein [Planctomycetota bacterium]
MNDPARIQDLSAAALAAALDSVDSDTTPEQLLAIEQFVKRIGGIANARLAIEMLSEIERAA